MSSVKLQPLRGLCRDCPKQFRDKELSRSLVKGHPVAVFRDGFEGIQSRFFYSRM